MVMDVLSEEQKGVCSWEDDGGQGQGLMKSGCTQGMTCMGVSWYGGWQG